MDESATMSVLPEGCLSQVLSLTSPRDACTAAALSSEFKSAADSDAVWERFLPPDHGELIARAVDPVVFGSKKELYHRLSESHILLDRGYLSLKLDKWNGNKCYMLGARELSIAWQDNTSYWEWRSIPESRGSRGLARPAKAIVSFCGIEAETTNVFLQKPEGHRRPRHVPQQNNYGFPRERKDGWMEIELGEFYCDQGRDGEVEMAFEEIVYRNWKSGLVVEGIEVRPKLVTTDG